MPGQKESCAEQLFTPVSSTKCTDIWRGAFPSDRKAVQTCNTHTHREDGMHKMPCFEIPTHYTVRILQGLKSKMPKEHFNTWDRIIWWPWLPNYHASNLIGLLQSQAPPKGLPSHPQWTHFGWRCLCQSVLQRCPVTAEYQTCGEIWIVTHHLPVNC